MTRRRLDTSATLNLTGAAGAAGAADAALSLGLDLDLGLGLGLGVDVAVGAAAASAGVAFAAGAAADAVSTACACLRPNLRPFTPSPEPVWNAAAAVAKNAVCLGSSCSAVARAAATGSMARLDTTTL